MVMLRRSVDISRHRLGPPRCSKHPELAGTLQWGQWMIELRRLRYFVVVAAERSFTKAAQVLNIAQPPLSKRIQELEEDIGAPLFDREARPLALTPAGRLLYDQSIQVIQRLDQLSSTMKQFVSAERRRFVVGLVPSGSHAHLPAIIRHYRKLAPDIELSLTEMTSLEQVAALKDGRIDVGFSRFRIEDSSIQREVLREEPMLAALPAEHPLATNDGTLELADLAAWPIIIYPGKPRPSYADHILSLFRDAGATPSTVIEVDDPQTALIMVAAGSGACMIPASARALAQPDVHIRPLPLQVTSPIILCHRLNDDSPSLLVLIQTIADLYDQWSIPVPRALRERLLSR